MIDTGKLIEELERLSEWLSEQYRAIYDGESTNYYDAYKTVDNTIAILKAKETEIRQLRLALDIAKGTCKGIVADGR